ncbi:hypothetical protein L218DRAFT_4953 [Marasmius fiardii PR-910]|nr:hypothetical protein L218DRAFT_4953 [Marasmius fiardii PR-910]
MLTHIDVMRDLRATKDMVPDEIWDQLEPDPEIVELEQQRERLKAGRYQYRDSEHAEQITALGKQIRAMRAQWVKDIRKQYREYYFDNRPTWDIEQQDTSSDDLEDDDSKHDFNEPDIDLDIPERSELARLLCKQPENLSLDELQERRIQAGECMVALSTKRETVRREVLTQRESEDRICKAESKGSSRSPSIDIKLLPSP